jgi:aminoacrylate hydrolase
MKRMAAPPLFLVPGLGGDGRFWGDNVAALAQQFTVIVHDHRGTGRSTLSKIAYSVEQMADDALQLIDALGYARVHWCGHSTGGAMGQVLAIEHASRIDRLVLSSTWAKTDAFFRRLFEVRALMLRELGPQAYLKASALALNMPSWVARLRYRPIGRRGQGERDHPAARDRALPHRRHRGARPARSIAEGPCKNPGDLRP